MRSISSSVAWLAASETGLPPNVEIVSPENASATSARATVAPIGMPFAMPLAKVMISGLTPQCSMPFQCVPVRPKPVCTSSQMKMPP